MNKIVIGLVGYGTVGSGIVKLLHERKKFIKQKFDAEFSVKKICDLRFRDRKQKRLGAIPLTTHYHEIVNDPDIDVVIELIGGVNPAFDIVQKALMNGKHVVTANKALISQRGKELFAIARKRRCDIYFEASVGAGIPLIKSITEGLAGNKFNSLYGIINGTSNFILSEMTKNNLTFKDALKEAQRKGYAESNPTLDINGMDAAHKLSILVFLALGRFVDVKKMYVEGINQILPIDIDYAHKENLSLKLLAIAKKVNNELEVRVHPTLISQDHPLASVNGIYNAVFLETDPLGDILLYGQGAGQMAAASGVMSDLINLATRHAHASATQVGILAREFSKIKLRNIGNIETKFYIRFLAIDRPGVLSKIAGILGRHGISIASVSQQVRKKTAAVPVIIVTHHAKERMVRLALEKICKLSIIKGKPLAIRMEKF